MLDVALSIWAWAGTIAGAVIIFALGVLIGVVILVALGALVTHAFIWACDKHDEFKERRIKKRLEEGAR